MHSRGQPVTYLTACGTQVPHIILIQLPFLLYPNPITSYPYPNHFLFLYFYYPFLLLRCLLSSNKHNPEPSIASFFYSVCTASKKFIDSKWETKQVDVIQGENLIQSEQEKNEVMELRRRKLYMGGHLVASSSSLGIILLNKPTFLLRQVERDD